MFRINENVKYKNASRSIFVDFISKKNERNFPRKYILFSTTILSFTHFTWESIIIWQEIIKKKLKTLIGFYVVSCFQLFLECVLYGFSIVKSVLQTVNVSKSFFVVVLIGVKSLLSLQSLCVFVYFIHIFSINVYCCYCNFCVLEFLSSTFCVFVQFQLMSEVLIITTTTNRNTYVVCVPFIRRRNTLINSICLKMCWEF